MERENTEKERQRAEEEKQRADEMDVKNSRIFLSAAR